MIASEDRGAAFVAQVTAGTTHEIRNILAIVKESAGLIEDLIFAFKRRGSLDQDKLTRSLQRIDAQVVRGTELLANLNRFAHSLDDAQDPIDVTREIQQLVYLCQFRARRKRHVLQVQPGGQNLTAVVDPFRFQMSLFGAVECCLEQLPEGSTVLISADQAGMMGAFPGRNAGLMSGYAAASQPYANYNMAGYQNTLLNQSRQDSSDMWLKNMIGNAGSTVAGYYTGGLLGGGGGGGGGGGYSGGGGGSLYGNAPQFNYGY